MARLKLQNVMKYMIIFSSLILVVYRKFPICFHIEEQQKECWFALFVSMKV